MQTWQVILISGFFGCIGGFLAYKILLMDYWNRQSLEKKFSKSIASIIEDFTRDHPNINIELKGTLINVNADDWVVARLTEKLNSLVDKDIRMIKSVSRNIDDIESRARRIEEAINRFPNDSYVQYGEDKYDIRGVLYEKIAAEVTPYIKLDDLVTRINNSQVNDKNN